MAKDSQKSLANPDSRRIQPYASLWSLLGDENLSYDPWSNFSPYSPQESDHPKFSGLCFPAPSSSSGPPAFC